MLQKFKQSNSGYTEVYAWGDDEYGQLGVSGKKNSKNYCSPRCCSFNIVIHQISCGDQHSAFIASNGFIYCMGNNDEGRLGLSQRDIKYSYSPCLVESLSRYHACKVMCGWGHTIALVDTGEVFTWGYGADGQLGNNNPNSQFTPQIVDFSHLNDSLQTIKAKDVFCGGRHSFLIMETNKVCCFGCAEFGQLGTGSANNEIIPCILENIYENIIDIACGDLHTIFLTESRKVYATGNNSNGELGVGHKKSSFLPIKIMMFDNFIIQKISASDHSSAITDKGELYLWGHFGFGESLFPQKIIIKNKIQNVALGNGFGLCFDSNGILYGWGNNNSGELGLGDYEHRTNINQIVTLQNKVIKDFSCGGNFVIALGNTLNKKLEENNINETTTRPAKLPMNLNINEKNNNSLDFFEGSRKVKSHHTRNNNSMGDFREENTLNFKKNIPNISIKYLTNEEIKNRQKASVYDSPNRMTDKEFEYVPGVNCDTQRTNSSPLRTDKYLQKFSQKNSEIKNNHIKSTQPQLNTTKHETELSSNKNQPNFKREIGNEFNILNKDIIKSRQYEYSTNKDYVFEPKNSNDTNKEYYYRSNDKTTEGLRNDRNFDNNKAELQQQQIDLLQNNGREIEMLKNDQVNLQEKYYKLEKNFFEIEDSLQNEKDKNLELQRLYEDQRVQNRNCMKELSEREQMLEKIEFLNQVVEEKEQELLLIRGDIPKKERFFEETVKNLKNNYESKIKNLENELENYAQQNEALHLQNQNGNDELVKKNEILLSIDEEMNDLKREYSSLEEMHKNDQLKIKKLNQEINSLASMEEENTLLKTLLEEKENEIILLNKSFGEIAERNKYYENIKNREQRKIEQTERELSTINDKALYMEKILTQKDSEIEQLKSLIEEKTLKSKKPGVQALNDRPEKYRNYNYESTSHTNYSNDIVPNSQDSFQKKERAITPNPSIKKLERTDLNPLIENNNRFDYNKAGIAERTYKKEFYQENQVDTKPIINFNNSLNNSVVFNSNLHDIKTKLTDLQKNKNALEKRMYDFEQRLKESKNK